MLHLTVKLYLCFKLYSVLAVLIQVVGGGPTIPVTLCSTATKSHQKCRNLTRSLTTTGASRRFSVQQFREIIAKRYSGFSFFFSFVFFERHAELNSKSRPLGTVFTCFKIKRSLLNLFVVASLCFEKSAGIRMILAGGELRY